MAGAFWVRNGFEGRAARGAGRASRPGMWRSDCQIWRRGVPCFGEVACEGEATLREGFWVGRGILL